MSTPLHLQPDQAYRDWVATWWRHAKAHDLHSDFPEMVVEAGHQYMQTQAAYSRIFYTYYKEDPDCGVAQPQLRDRFRALREARWFWQDLVLRLDLDTDIEELY